jgi:uncharacterized protein (TIGR02466 family)|tara:strand:- start:280 stop:891 length:612 start_codon:yes stop_codon:yes gene_type:complete
VRDKLKVHNLFPTALGESVRNLTSKELDFFDKLKDQRRNKNAGNSYTKDIHVLNNPELSDLKTDLTDIVNDYFQEVYQPEYDVKVYITISWVNYTESGQWHHAHFHSNSVISGVLYIDTNDEDTITFQNPVEGNLGFSLKSKNHNHWNSSSWWWPTPKNSLLLFPSSLSHKVDITTNQNTRSSLAFNTFLKGQINDDLVELIL